MLCLSTVTISFRKRTIQTNLPVVDDWGIHLPLQALQLIIMLLSHRPPPGKEKAEAAHS